MHEQKRQLSQQQPRLITTLRPACKVFFLLRLRLAALICTLDCLLDPAPRSVASCMSVCRWGNPASSSCGSSPRRPFCKVHIVTVSASVRQCPYGLSSICRPAPRP